MRFRPRAFRTFRLVPRGTTPPPPPPPPPSGWNKEARLALVAPSAQLTGHVVVIDETATELKPSGSGGVLTSPTAQDVRMEAVADGSSLPWDLWHYDSSTGRLVAAVRLGDVAAGAPLQWRLLAGKSGASEQNMSGTWTDALAAWLGSDGTNRQGTTARNLTLSGVVADSTDPWIGIFDGTSSKASLTDASFLSGLTEFSIEALVRADKTGSDMRIIDQGANDTGGAGHGLMMEYGDAGYRAPSATSIIAININVQESSTSNIFTLRYESASNIHTTDWQHLLLSWKSGELPKLYVNGVLDTPSWVGRIDYDGGWTTEQNVPVSGTTLMPSGDLAIGGLGAAPMWNGAVAFVVIRPRALGATQALLLARNALSARRVYGMSAFTSPDPSDKPVVAMPVEATQDVSVTVDYDVVSAAVDDGTPTLTSADSTAGAVSAASVASGKLRVTSGATGGDGEAAFTLTGASAETSSSKLYLTVTGGSNTSEKEYPSALRTVSVSTGSELVSALTNAQPGDHIVMSDGTYTNASDFTTSVDGTASAPIVIRAANKLLAKLATRLVVQNPYYYLWGLDIDGVQLNIDPGADYTVVRRCQGRNYSSYQGIWCRVKASNCRFEYCDISMPDCRGISMDLGAGARNLTIERCYFHDWGPNAANDQTFEPIQVGFGVADTDISAGAVIRLCLFENINQNNKENETISLKSSGNIVEQCHLKDARQITVRHGENNRVDGCRLENISGTKPTRVQVFDELNKVLTCVAPEIQLSAGDVEPDGMTSSSQHPAAWNCKVISCNGTAIVGAQESTTYTVKAQNNTIEDHTGTVTLVHEQNTTQVGTASESGLPTITLTTADVGVNADSPPGELPTALRTVNVSNSSELSSAISTAKPGDHIVLASGNYSGLTISINGTSSNPIVIRPATKHGAKFTGKVTLSSTYVWLYQLHFDGADSYSLDLYESDWCTIRRNKFTQDNAVRIMRSRDCEIAYNLFELPGLARAENTDCILFNPRYTQDSSANRFIERVHVHRNLFTTASIVNDSTNIRCRAIYVSTFWQPDYPDLNCTIEYNLFDSYGRGRIIYSKMGGITVQYNTIIIPDSWTVTGTMALVQRHDYGNTWQGNWIEGVGYVDAFDNASLWNGNKIVGNGAFRVFAGEGDPNSAGAHIAANGHTFAWNEGTIKVGYEYYVGNGPFIKADNNRIEAHTGSVELLEWQQNTTITSTSNYTQVIPVKLTRNDVGPDAP